MVAFQQGDDQVYRALSDDSPPSDIEPSIPLIKNDKTDANGAQAAPVRDDRSRKSSSNCSDRPALSQSISGGYYNCRYVLLCMGAVSPEMNWFGFVICSLQSGFVAAKQNEKSAPKRVHNGPRCIRPERPANIAR